MAPSTVEQHQFTSQPSDTFRERQAQKSHSLTPMWAGIAGTRVNGDKGYEVALSIHDSVYNTDFSATVLSYDANDSEKQSHLIEDHIVAAFRKFSEEHYCKFLGAGVTNALLSDAPNVCTRLWLELDIVPIVFNIKPFHADSTTRTNIKHRIHSISASFAPSGAQTPTMYVDHTTLNPNAASGKLPIPRSLDEQADSAARKALMYFGPNNNPRLSIGPRNQVAVDAGGKIHLLDDLEEYRKSCRAPTWAAVQQLADELRENNVKIGFFSSTPQGGGVALMRHALIRFMSALDVDVAWYVPNPSPAVFRTTKNNHNILQGVADPSLRLTQEQKSAFDEWILKNGLRWTAEGGPLAKGGVDIAFIDDPQMPGLIPLIRKVRPEIPIIYRSHIEIRSDLVHKPGSPQEEVWQYLWSNIKLADLFISHPVSKFVPSDVPLEKVCLLGAATDWLDGLNKDLSEWDSAYYMSQFRSLCVTEKMRELAWPEREYICQVARFDPSKGIPAVVDSYARMRDTLKEKGIDGNAAPQLLICGHGAVDDPDASIIYDQISQLVASEKYSRYQSDIVLMRLPPSDQLLNALMANAKIALQLSTREGFEVKVSEALHAGRPIVACRTGGIPLQIQHGKSGYLCEPGDNEAVARHLVDLYTDKELYARMSKFARENVSDEVGTVGNAAAWMYLAVMYSRGEKLKPNGKWINDMLRQETNQPYADDEPRLPRGVDVVGTD